MAAHAPACHNAGMTETQQAPAGWYPNPDGKGQLRWWDGAAWGPTTPPRRRTGNGVTSLVLGIVALMTIAFRDPTGITYVLALVGLAFGMIAAAQARHLPTIKGLWVAGIVLNTLTLLIAALFMRA